MQGYLFCKPVPGEVFETLLLSPDTVRSVSKGQRLSNL
jgi:hypothetical protein